MGDKQLETVKKLLLDLENMIVRSKKAGEPKESVQLLEAQAKFIRTQLDIRQLASKLTDKTLTDKARDVINDKLRELAVVNNSISADSSFTSNVSNILSAKPNENNS